MDNVMELVGDGVMITLIGMTIVYVMLTMLVGIVHGLNAFCKLFTGAPAPSGSGAIDDETIGVIAAAIGRYRRDHDDPA